MKIETQAREDHQVKLITELEQELFEKFKHQAARKISSETKIPGFRPGKAPYNIVQRIVGEEAIQNEAIEMIIDDIYPKVLDEAKIDPGGPGKLEDVVSYDPLTLAFVVPLAPVVDLKDYRSVRLPYEPEPLSEEEVDKFFVNLRRAYATVEPLERPAQEGDLVFGTLVGKLAHPAEGEEAEIVKETPIQVIVRSPEEKNPEGEEWPFEGFSWQLIGLSAEDVKTLSHSYPEDNKYGDLSGKEVDFTVNVQSVKLLKQPELNDEFAQTAGDFNNMEEMRSSVRTRLEESAHEEYDRDYFSQLLDKIGEQAQIEYPPQALQDENEEVLRSVEADLARQNMDLETYLKVREKDKETFLAEEITPVAKRRLERSLLMDEVARLEKIEVKDDDIQTEFTNTYSDLMSTQSFKEAQKKLSSKELANAIAMEAFARVMNRRVQERLRAIATGEAEKAEAEAATQTEAEAGKEEPAAELAEAPAEAPGSASEEPASQPAEEAPASQEGAEEAAED